MSSGKWRPFCRGIDVLSNWKKNIQAISTVFDEKCFEWHQKNQLAYIHISLLFSKTTLPYITNITFRKTWKLWVWCYDSEIRLLPEIRTVASKIVHFYHSVYVLIKCILRLVVVVAVATAGEEAVCTVTIMSIWYLVQSLRTNKISCKYMPFPRLKHRLGDIWIYVCNSRTYCQWHQFLPIFTCR